MGTRKIFLAGVVVVLFVGLAAPSALATIPDTERSALIALFESTNGPNWTENENWLIASGEFSEPGTECTW